MRKYIDAEELKVFMRTMLTGNDLYTSNGIDEFVDRLPAADVVKRVYRGRRLSDNLVKVVRCRECKYYIEREDGYICANDYLYKDSEWFCADGEKNE